MYQTVFQRYELKYLITHAQKERVLSRIIQYTVPDSYGRSVIRNIYFDTDNYRLIRRSLERPAYKEKLRLRSYCLATAESRVFAELKKKYRSVVYKRRVPLCEQDGISWLVDGKAPPVRSQITDEIDYFVSYYGPVRPAMFLSYRREAFYSVSDRNLRITFDDNIVCNSEDLSLEHEVTGHSLLRDGYVLMEIKCAGSVPLWLASLLSEEKIYKTSFSKYGTAYQTLILPTLKENKIYD